MSKRTQSGGPAKRCGKVQKGVVGETRYFDEWERIYHRARPAYDARRLNQYHTGAVVRQFEEMRLPDRLSGAAKIFGEAGIPKKVLNELERSRDTMKREGRNHMLRWLDIVRRMPSRIHHQEAVDGFALECVLEELDATGGVWLPCEEQTCAERVRRFGDFANAYTQYLDFWKADLHRGLTRDKRLTARKVKYRKCVELDCWLILVWPVVIEHQWTYSDVERVRRMRFEGREPDECERVLRADREKIKQRCERLSLHIATSRGRPRNYANPPAMLQLAMQIRA